MAGNNEDVPVARFVLENAVVVAVENKTFVDGAGKERSYQEASLVVGLEHFVATVQAEVVGQIVPMRQYPRLVVHPRAVGAPGGGRAVRLRILGLER